MTYSVVMFVTRASSLTIEQFQDYYEQKHIPLVYSMVSDVWPATFYRRYFVRINRKGFGGPANPDHPLLTLRGELNETECDCVAEMTFLSEKAFQAFYRRIYEKETAAIVAESENNFLESGKLRVIVVGETFSTGPDGVTSSEKNEITRNEASDSEMSSSERSA